MEKLQIVREKELVIGKGEERFKDRIDVKMLLHNTIPGYLPLRIQYVDNQSVLLYSTRGMAALEEILQNRGGNYTVIRGIYSGLLEIVKKSREYFLDLSHVVLSPSLLYWDISGGLPAVCYFPGEILQWEAQIEELSQYLLQKANHKDKKCVSFLYGIYDFIAQNGFREQGVERYLAERMDRPSEGLERENQGRRKRGEEKPVFWLQRIFSEEGLEDRIPVTQAGISVGRAEENQLTLPMLQISRRHARVELDEGRIFLTDLNSANGVFLNKRRLLPGHPTLCISGDVISFADISYRVEDPEKQD